MTKSDYKKIMEAFEAVSSDSMLLCAPRRHSLEPCALLREGMLGKIHEKVKSLCSLGLTSEQALTLLMADDQAKAALESLKVTDLAFTSNYTITRHQVQKAPLYSVTPALNLLLNDTEVKDSVPVRFFAPPSSSCYIEFDPPEMRRQSSFRTFAGGLNLICEGCYVQESRFDRMPPTSQELREILELDPNLPVRAVHVGFSSSPVTREGLGIHGVAEDTVDFMTFYIQDEDEQIGDMLQRHFRLHDKRSNLSQSVSQQAREFSESYRHNVMHLVRVLFYLGVEKRHRNVVNEASDLEKRIESIADKKKRKLQKQLNRTYDRIVIGPNEYVPIDKRLISGDLPQGTKKPHYRRGYFGVRYVGTGSAKTPELRRVKETMVNDHLLSGKDAQARDYEIR